MLKRSILLVVILSALVAGCSSVVTPGEISMRGSGKIVTRDYQLDGFTGIDACCGFQVTVTGGSAFKVSVTTDDNIASVLSVTKEGNILRLNLDRSKAISVQSTRLEATVTMPTLEMLTLSGGSQLNMAQPAPQIGDLVLNFSGGSRTDLGANVVRKANVTLSGGSHATVNVTGNLDYDLSGGSELRYTGNPQLGKTSTSGGSSASKF